VSELAVADLGRASYSRALRLQQRLLERVRREPQRAFLILVEHHPPVVTLGRSAKAEHLLAGPEKLAAAGVEVHESTRGGDVTYHGPGQLVGYPILKVRDVRGYLRELEEVLIRALSRLGVAAERRAGLTGVWAGQEKVAAIGIAVRRWVAYHGFCLNVASDLSGFESIVPCGLREYDVTSVSRLLEREVPLGEVKPAVIECTVDVFGFSGAREESIDA
jgi:lipoate-protein ligase B